MEKASEGANELDPEKDLLPKNDKWKTVPEKRANAHYPLGQGEEYLQQQEKMQEGHDKNIATDTYEQQRIERGDKLSTLKDYEGNLPEEESETKE